MIALPIIFSSILWILSFPVALKSGNLVPAWLSALSISFALVPVILLLRRRSPRDNFRLGYVFGFISNGGVFFWVIVAMQKYGNLGVFVSTLILLTMICTLAFLPALAFWGITKLRGRVPMWLSGSILFTLLYWVLNYFPVGGFPWASPAYSLYGVLHLIQIGDLVGVCGINFVILLCNFVLAELWTAKARPEQREYLKTGLALFLVLFAATFAYGFKKLHPRDEAKGKKPDPLHIALLQGNIPQDQKWNGSAELSILQTYRDLSAAASQKKPDLIVWPEASLPMAISRSTNRLAFLKGAASSDTILGAPTWTHEHGKQFFYNSAFDVAQDGTVSYRYDKLHLVPFGEYVPLSNILPMHYIVPSVAGNFREGDAPSTLPQVKGSPFGILICYEVLFPELSVDAVKKGAQWLVNITNDAWFDYTSGPFQHSHFGIFRAIETRRNIVRAANTGVTAWFDSYGNIHDATALFTRTIVDAWVVPSTEITFYVRYPYLVQIVLGLLLLTAIVSGVFRVR